MSAAHRHTIPDLNSPADASSSHLEASHTDSRVDGASPPSVSPTDHSRSRSKLQHPCQTHPRTQTDGHTHTQTQTQTHALPSRIEQVQLRTRVAALERELAASRRNQQAIVDQYERVLEDRECRPCSTTTDGSATSADERAQTQGQARTQASDSTASSRPAAARSRSRPSSDSSSSSRLTDPLTALRRVLSSVRR